MELFYVDGDRQVGPIGESQFESLIKTKKINAKTLVWQQGMSQWEEMGTFLGRNAPTYNAAQSLVQSAELPRHIELVGNRCEITLQLGQGLIVIARTGKFGAQEELPGLGILKLG